MAVLELLKINKIYARQDKQNGEIRIYLNQEHKNDDYHKLLEEAEEKANG